MAAVCRQALARHSYRQLLDGCMVPSAGQLSSSLHAVAVTLPVVACFVVHGGCRCTRVHVHHRQQDARVWRWSAICAHDCSHCSAAKVSLRPPAVPSSLRRRPGAA